MTNRYEMTIIVTEERVYTVEATDLEAAMREVESYDIAMLNPDDTFDTDYSIKMVKVVAVDGKEVDGPTVYEATAGGAP